MDKAEDPKVHGTSAACSLIFNGVLCYFFYTYAYNNPDAGECWAIDGVDTPKTTETAGYTNVSNQFHLWFWWGFIINVMGLTMAVTQFLYAATENSCFKCLNGLIGCPLGCGGLAWFIAGAVLRFRYVGTVCSGDDQMNDLAVPGVQYESGAFMYWYYLITGIIIAAMLCCCCTCGIVMVAKGGH